MATAATDDRPLGREDAGLADLRREALRLMLAVVGCLAFVQLFADGWVLVYRPFGWGLILGVISEVLLGIMAWALGTRFQQLSQRPAREERVEYVRRLMAGRSS